MTAAGLSRIESELEIHLPKIYKDQVSPFPIAALDGNSDWMLWDNADALIALNLKLRERSWTKRVHAMGEDGSGSSDAIDLEDSEAGVFWFGCQQLDVNATERSDEKVDQWIERQLEYIRHDLKADDIDPDKEPGKPCPKKGSFWRKLIDWILLVIVAIAVLTVYAVVRRCAIGR